MRPPWAALTREEEHAEREADDRMTRAAAIADQWGALDRMIAEAVRHGDYWFDGPMDDARDVAATVIKRLGVME